MSNVFPNGITLVHRIFNKIAPAGKTDSDAKPAVQPDDTQAYRTCRSGTNRGFGRTAPACAGEGGQLAGLIVATADRDVQDAVTQYWRRQAARELLRRAFRFNRDLNHAIHFTLLTKCGPSEFLGLRWADVTAGTIQLLQNNGITVLRKTAELQDLLLDVAEENNRCSPYVFGGRRTPTVARFQQMLDEFAFERDVAPLSWRDIVELSWPMTANENGQSFNAFLSEVPLILFLLIHGHEPCATSRQAIRNTASKCASGWFRGFVRVKAEF